MAILAVFPALSAPGQVQPAGGGPPAATAEQDIRHLVTRYYDAYAAKDLETLGALWHPKGPGRHARSAMLVEFEIRDVAVKSIALRDFKTGPGGSQVRVIAELRVREARSVRSRSERRVRDMTFLQDESGAWKVWNDASPAMLLGRRLLSVPPGERPALLAAEPELASDDCLTGLGLEANRLRSQGGIAAVLDALATREQVARMLENEHALASALVDSGITLQVTGQVEAAGKAYTEAREIYARVGTGTEVATVDANLASVAYLAGDYALALARYQQALEVFEAAGDQQARVASLQHGVGNAQYMQGQFERALEAYGRALAITEAAGHKGPAAAALLAIGMVHKELGSYARAGDAYARSAVLAAEAGDLSASARALHGQGEVCRLQGDHGQALYSFHRALDAWAKVQDPPNRTMTMFAIGQVHAMEGSFTAAVDWYQKALEVDTAGGNRPGVARDVGGLAGAHFAMGQADTALAEYEKSLEIREALDDQPGAAWTLLHMGVLHMSQSRHDEALRVYLRAIGIAEKIGDQPALGVAHALKASAEQAAGSPEQALESVGRAMVFAGRTEQHDAIAFARTVEGKVHRDAGRPASARAAFEAAVEALGKVPVGPSAETFFTDRRDPYLALADLFVREGDGVAAMDWLERGRQHALAVLLGGDGAIVTKGLAPAERDEEQAAVKAFRSAAVRLRRERGRTAPDPAREAALREELAGAASARDEVRARLFGAHPELRVLRAQAEPVPIQTLLPSVLGRADALLTFAVTDSRTHVLVARVASGQAAGASPAAAPTVTVHAATVEIASADLAARVARLRDAIRTFDEAAPALSVDLYRLLLLPVESHLLGPTRLVVVPDASLWWLPFEALRSPGGRYLVERAAISYAPFAGALSALSQAAAGRIPNGRVLSLGAPVLSKDAQERVALLRPGQKLEVPAGVEREVRAVAAIAGPARSQVVLGANATASPLEEGAPPGTIAHVAAPFLPSDAGPLHSLLVLSPAGGGENGLTEIGSALGWNLPAAAAVLPHAEGGTQGLGGAFVALSWSLFVAGTPAVAVSRWPLAARAPARLDPLVAGFYRALLAASPDAKTALRPGEAARRAARRLLAAPATKHPGHWAGLMVIGR